MVKFNGVDISIYSAYEEDSEADLSSYENWLDETGLDDSFAGDDDREVLGTQDRYELACLRAGVSPLW